MFPFFYSDFEYKCLQIMRSHESLEENTNEKRGIFLGRQDLEQGPPQKL